LLANRVKFSEFRRKSSQPAPILGFPSLRIASQLEAVYQYPHVCYVHRVGSISRTPMPRSCSRRSPSWFCASLPPSQSFPLFPNCWRRRQVHPQEDPRVAIATAVKVILFYPQLAGAGRHWTALAGTRRRWLARTGLAWAGMGWHGQLWTGMGWHAMAWYSMV
jgi:hypothetical protein